MEKARLDALACKTNSCLLNGLSLFGSENALKKTTNAASTEASVREISIDILVPLVDVNNAMKTKRNIIDRNCLLKHPSLFIFLSIERFLRPECESFASSYPIVATELPKHAMKIQIQLAKIKKPALLSRSSCITFISAASRLSA